MRTMVGFEGFARRRSCRGLLWAFAAGLLLSASLCANAQAADGEGDGASTGIADWDTASVTVDGHVIFSVRGISGFPAKRRAAEIRDRTISVAADERFSTGAVTLAEKGDRTDVLAGDLLILSVFDVDAEMEGVDRKLLAENVQLRLREAMTDYRLDRSPRVLLRNSLYALGVTLVAAGLFFGFRKGFRSLDDLVSRRLKDHLKALEAQSARFIRAQQVAKILRGVIRAIYLLLVVLILYFYLNFVLGLYPWTRPVAAWLFDLILNPLRSMGESVLTTIPDLVFLVILYVVTRYILRMIRAFFENIDSGVIHLASFEQEWAWPTYRILRLLVVIFALVVAYPYIPGSESAAFKGISILLGLIVSIGSSSIIANIIAQPDLPPTVQDRGPREDQRHDRGCDGDAGAGDPAEVPQERGDRDPEHRHSQRAGRQLQLTGGETGADPAHHGRHWLRDALAAGRSHAQAGGGPNARPAQKAGALRAPEDPRGLRRHLRDQRLLQRPEANDAALLMPLYSALHRNILDVFNEYGVAIMTPAYESDPEQPKLVPKDQWYAAPATVPAENGAA